MTTFLELCDPRRNSLAVSASDISWESISELSKLHGVTSFLFYRTRSLGIKLPEQIEKEWLGYYLYQIAEEKKARSQIKELKEILGPEGIPFILLKGASAMLRLYPEPGLRTLGDLDILIPADKASAFKRIMRTKGFKPLATLTSSEDEDLQQFECHLDPLCKEDALMIEAHVNILGGKGNYSIALPEIWQDKEKINFNGIATNHLSKEHFLIHIFLHWIKDFSFRGFAEAKGFIDALCALKTWRVDWSRFRDVARRWEVEKEVMPLIAAMNHYWQAGDPSPTIAEPLALHILVSGKQDREKYFYAKLPESYIDRFLRVRKLPDTAHQVRYAFHLLFPIPENLRWRYNLSSKSSIIPYYFVHLFSTWKRFLRGLWYQILFHPK